MPEFAPEDDDTDDELQADRVEIDPALFGELPDGPIEIVDQDGNGLISGQAQHEWEREATIVGMTRACPYCDGSVNEREVESPNGDSLQKLTCTDCGERWTTNREKGFTGSV